MNKMYYYGCMGILAASAMLSSCSSDNDDPTPSPNPGSEEDVVASLQAAIGCPLVNYF